MSKHERARLVPMKQAPFSKFYTHAEKEVFHGHVPAVGELFPFSFLFGSWRTTSELQQDESDSGSETVEKSSDLGRFLF